MKILKLTLSKLPFEVMVTGEKKHEFRNDSDWMRSRLYTPKHAARKHFDAVEFTWGYGANRPRFTCRYLGHTFGHERFTYSNGLTVEANPNGIVLKLGEIISIENFQPQKCCGKWDEYGVCTCDFPQHKKINLEN